MNFYQRYCGDYAVNTADLSLVEHGVYTVLLDYCYATELGCPLGYPTLYRLARAITDEEQLAVRTVADRFFPIGADGQRHNARVEKELSLAIKRIAVARVNGAKGGQHTQQDAQRGTQRGTHGAGSPTPTPEVKTKPPVRSSTTPSAGFELFWKTWPASKRKVAKQACWAKWQDRKCNDLVGDIVAHVTAMKASKQWLDGYDPAPLTYLNQWRWRDGLPAKDADPFEGAI